MNLTSRYCIYHHIYYLELHLEIVLCNCNDQVKKPLVKTMTTGLNLYFSLCSHLRSNLTRYCSATLSSFYLLVIVKLLKCKLRDQFYFVFHLTQFKLCNINSLHNVRNFFKQKVKISCGVCQPSNLKVYFIVSAHRHPLFRLFVRWTKELKILYVVTSDWCIIAVFFRKKKKCLRCFKKFVGVLPEYFQYIFHSLVIRRQLNNANNVTIKAMPNDVWNW